MGCINWDRLVCLHIHEWVSVLWFCFHLLSKLGQTYWQACWMGRRRRKGAFLTYLSSDARHPPQTSQSAAASRWSSHDQLAHPLAVVQQQAKAKTSFLLPSGSKTQVRVCWTFVWNENSAYFPFFSNAPRSLSFSSLRSPEWKKTVVVAFATRTPCSKLSS